MGAFSVQENARELREKLKGEIGEKVNIERIPPIGKLELDPSMILIKQKPSEMNSEPETTKTLG